MPHAVPLQAGDPRRVGRYQLTGRLDGIPSDDPIFLGSAPDGAQVSITVLAGHWDGAARDRFSAEAAVARRVPPFCAARVLDAGLDGEDAYLVSEYIPGATLLELVAEYGIRTGTQLEALAIGMATGLASVHQAGLVHGNFGPQYVILPRSGPPHVVEFGITPPYGSATPSADMLAWAQTVVFAATGRPPSQRADLDALPEHIRDPVQHCLELDPSERPAARAVVQFLLGGGSLPAGVLAEGSRRAARVATWAAFLAEPAPSREPGTGTYRGRAGAPQSPYGMRPGPAVRGDAGPRPPWSPAPSRREHGSGSARHSADDAGPEGRAPGPRRAARARRTGRRRVVPWLVAGAGVVVVLVAVLVVHLLQGGTNSSANSALSANASRSAGATASPGPVTPAAFNGAWAGTVTSPLTTFNVTISLTSGQGSGTMSYTAAGGVSCSGGLTVTSASASEMIAKMVAGQNGCSTGTVTITLAGTNAIKFSLQGSPAATGTLSRQ